ncbi:DNA primase, partial [Bacillus cereus]
VYLEDTATAFAGSWGDSGGGEFQKGHFTQLLAFLMDCSEEEVIDYLLEEYASDWDGESKLHLDMSRLKIRGKTYGLDMNLIEGFTGASEYLRSRGITDEVQALYN